MKFEKIIAYGMLIFAIGFNVWIYRAEPTAKIDPNDNTFQFALVDRTNQIWDVAWRTKNFALLFDHWVPNWAEGYNLPYYYSHIPQILIVASWRLLHLGSLFQYYHWIIYLLLSIFPLSVFLALRITGLSWLTAGFGALIASQISTDGFYGLDPASYLWRGYGLSSQLFAMIWLPLAIAYAYRGKVLPAILTLAATSTGHLGIGIIACISVAIIAFRKAFWILGGALLLLAYWIVPAYVHNNFHNFSVWDPIWKFDSYGAPEVLTRLFNGDLFDFGRFPVLTILVFLGLFAGFRGPYVSFSLLFLTFLLLYFGRTTWGSLIDLIPFMKEFHISRFIVGVDLAALFLIPIAIEKIRSLVVFIVLVVFVVLGVYPQTIRYAAHNDVLIKQANENYSKSESDTTSLLSTLKELQKTKPGRVYSGRGGSWGRDFRIAETPYYMHLSTYGIPTVLWLPQTWSPNSDTEQYFSEDQTKDYVLYNIRYVVTPNGELVEPQPFWKLVKETPSWKLYEVQTEGYITTGVRPAMVSSSKENFLNVVRLWIQSDFPKQGLYPELTFDSQYPKDSGLPNFRMLDEVTYKVPDGSTHNLFSEPPLYISPITPIPPISLISQSSDSDMVFKATVETKEDCIECIVVLRQTFHPSWKATIDGELVEPFSVFPFYTAVELNVQGIHEIIFSYEPSTLKVILLLLGVISLGVLFFSFKML